MKMFEVNGNLEDEENFLIFFNYILHIRNYFTELFGIDIMNRIGLYVDNGTKMSGYTPITTVVLNKYIIIKLGIKNFNDVEIITFQFAHELGHYVFRSIIGINKKKACVLEENLCTALSLITIKHFFPKSISFWLDYVEKLEDERYKRGAEIVKKSNFQAENVVDLIYDYCNKYDLVNDII